MQSSTTTLTEEVLELVCWSEEELSQYKYQQGLIYLHWYLPCSPQRRSALEQSKLYWGWWKNLWNERDEVFVSNYTLWQLKLTNIQLIYKELHNGRLIANDGTKPPKVVLEGVKN